MPTLTLGALGGLDKASSKHCQSVFFFADTGTRVELQIPTQSHHRESAITQAQARAKTLAYNVAPCSSLLTAEKRRASMQIVFHTGTTISPWATFDLLN